MRSSTLGRRPLPRAGLVDRQQVAGHRPPSRAYWVITTPAPVGVASTSRSLACGPSAANIRCPAPEHDRVHEQQQLVDEVLGEQRPQQRAAAQEREAGAVGQRLDRGDVGQQHGVRPDQRLGERCRDDELAARVQPRRERVVGAPGPRAVEELVGAAAEQQVGLALHVPAHDAALHGIGGVGHGPPAVGEAAALVLVGAARGLHDAVQADRLDGTDLPHGSSSWFSPPTRSRSGQSTAAPDSCRASRTMLNGVSAARRAA